MALELPPTVTERWLRICTSIYGGTRGLVDSIMGNLCVFAEVRGVNAGHFLGGRLQSLSFVVPSGSGLEGGFTGLDVTTGRRGSINIRIEAATHGSCTNI